MKRVLFFKQTMGATGGLEKYSRRLLKAFAERGCEVTLVTGSPCSEMIPGVQTVSLPLLGLFGFQKLKKWDKATLEFAQTHPHDLAFTLDRITSATHIRAGNGVHASFLQKRKESPLRQLSFKLNPLHRTILHLETLGFESPSLRKLIVNSHMVKEEILSHYQVDPSKIAVHHNGVEHEEMAPAFAKWPQTREELQKELRLDPGMFTFLFVGHHYKRKGLDELLSGLALVPRARLLVVGKEKNMQRYDSLVKKFKMEARVHFLGERSDVRKLYALADAAVIPSLYDPFANVTVEALAMGLFVVSSAFNGGKEVLDAENGTVIENLFDPESVAASLQVALRFSKTTLSAQKIRAKTAPLDFRGQLTRLIETCLN